LRGYCPLAVNQPESAAGPGFVHHLDALPTSPNGGRSKSATGCPGDGGSDGGCGGWAAGATVKERVRAIVFDDSAYSRDRSKKVELLARVKDHVTGRYFKGFRKFTAGWTDGATFIPLAFALLSSANTKNRLYEQGPDIPQGSPGEHRRKEAVQPGTTVMLDMLDQILVHIQDFQYVLFDSWFSWPDVIKKVKARQRDVICMLKDMPKILTIVCIRYMLLAVENREQKDSRTYGEIFYQFCDEVTDLDFTQAFLYILDLFTQTLRENLFLFGIDGGSASGCIHG
jgi:hypothetical protein